MSHPRQAPGLLATCCIPWREDFSFDREIFCRTVRLLRDNLTPDLYVFGTAGEGHAVSDAQFGEICRAFWAEMQTVGARPMVGVISLSLSTIIERIELARAIGFRRFQVSLPSWGALTETEVRRFFVEVCDRFPDCDFLHYNLARTKRLVTAAEYVELARRHPNLVATKHGTGVPEVIDALMKEAGQLTHFFTEAGFARAALQGECGFLVSVCSLDFKIAKDFFAAGQARDSAEMARIASEARQLIDVLFRHNQSGAHMDGAFDKVFCRWHDPDFPLRLLPPYVAYEEAHFSAFKREALAAVTRWFER